MTDKHKVFISYHHKNDEGYKKRFEDLFTEQTDTIVSKAVQDGDIDPTISDDRARQLIRNNNIQDSTVTVVLIGAHTYTRKHIDWEIGSSIRGTKASTRSGLLGILLPSHPDFKRSGGVRNKLLSQRLVDNFKCDYAQLQKWSEDSAEVKRWIHQAFLNRDKINPDNSEIGYKKNHKIIDITTLNP